MKKVFVCLVLVVTWFGLFHGAHAAAPEPRGVSAEQVLGVDSAGISLVSAVPIISDAARMVAEQAIAGLPSGMRGWEVIPGVVRSDGVEAFRVEVNVNGPVSSVTFDINNLALIPSTPTRWELRDDGMEGDRVAGDFIFTSSVFRYASSDAPTYYRNDSTSPAGLDVKQIGTVNIEELDGTVTSFLHNPYVGVLRSDIPVTPKVKLASDVVVSPHLVNVRIDGLAAQSYLRGFAGSVPTLAQRVYSVLPDSFDFLILFSTNKVERLPASSSSNFNAGVHSLVQVNYTGTGLDPFDNSAAFGSNGRLLGISVLDTYERGILSNNVTHELSHQWGSFTSLLNDGTAHYSNRSSVGSLIGGFKWVDNGDGTFTFDCNEGRNGAHLAAPLDLYMMGLVDASEVPDVHTVGTGVDIGAKCDGEPVLSSEIVSTVTVEDIQAQYGVRTPGPATAKRHFRLAFIAESHGRLLNPSEMTFYEILAAHYTKLVPAKDPDPYQGFNWVPVTRFFGHGTTWRSDVCRRPSRRCW